MNEHPTEMTTDGRHDKLELDPTTTADRGFSFPELLVTISLLGLLATIVIFGASGLRAEAAEYSCAADQRTLWTAAESYFVQNETDVIPATGVDSDRFERTLADNGFLRSTSTNYDVDSDGSTTPEGNSPC